MFNFPFYTSHFFLINSALCARIYEFNYAYAFLILYLTSILHHSNCSFGFADVVRILDKLAIAIVVILGTCKFVTTTKYTFAQRAIVVGMFACSVISYTTGLSQSNVMHSVLVHGSALIGHACICY
jgi:hypothetical protein